MHGEPWRKQASQTGPPALLVARKAGSCQPAYRRRALYETRERKRDSKGHFERGIARAREKSPSRGLRPARKPRRKKRALKETRLRET